MKTLHATIVVCLAQIVAVIAFLGPASVTLADGHLTGRWSNGGDMEVVAIHGALMSNGKVLAFGYKDRHHVEDETGRFQVWNPSNRSPETPSSVINGWNPFCSGHCFLGDGRLFVAGGHKASWAHRSSSADRVGIATVTSSGQIRWQRNFEKMEDLRWYPTVVTLANGDCFILGGSAPFAADNWKDTNEDVEYFSLANNYLVRHNETRRDFPRDRRFLYPAGDNRLKVEDGKRLAGLYPLTHLVPTDGGRAAPDGLLFVVTESFARLYNPTTNELVGGIKIDVGGFRTWWTQGSSVLLPIDIDQNGVGPDSVRVMLIGGGSKGDSSPDAPARATADIYRYTMRPPAVRFERSVRLAHRRLMGDSVLLPDGNVVIVGGAEEGYTNENNQRVLHAELLRQTSRGNWESLELAPAETPRGYHATALLLPDGAVFVAGGNGGWDNGPVNEFKGVEVFDPPYKFIGEAPQIFSAPEELRSGQSFSVQASAGVEPVVVLVRHGSRTHSLDTDQRVLRLNARASAAAHGRQTLEATMPINATFAPPGPYMIFVLKPATVEGALQQLIPSEARHVIVRVGSSCPDEQATSLRVTIQTGSDDLRGGNDNAFASFLENGSPVVSEFALNRSSRWDNFSTHSVSLSLPQPLSLSRLQQLKIRTTFGGGSGGDNWNINRVTVHYRVGPGPWKHLWTEASNPVARLTGTYKTWVGNVDCNSTVPRPGMTNGVKVTITTGGDDLRGGSRAWASVLDARNGVVVTEFPLNGGQNWKNNSVHTVEEHFGTPVSVSLLRKLKVRTNFGGGAGGDNWDIARVTVSYVDQVGRWHQFLDLSGNPLARLTGDRKRWISDEPPPPPPEGQASHVRVTIRTGGDDLRDRAWFSILDGSTVVVPEFPIGGVSGWPNGSTRTVSRSLARPIAVSRLNRIKIRTNFGSGFGGDNWNVDRVTVQYRAVGRTSWQTLRTLSGSPLVRLTGNRKSWVGALTN